ncbi:MAG TPA: cytochrome c3 family protein [Pyrinomonadaceae bacterium]|nr:cytochrome c3 family protein [Pyrinomonadaceae bacterium]
MLGKAIAFTAGAILVVAAIVLAARPSYLGVRAGHADENYLKSTDCRSCHEDHFASWARTFHSRMTQEARPASIQGDFTKANTFDYLGIKARMEQRGDRFFMTFNFPDGRAQTVSVDRTVGSRRIEQYLTKQQGQYTRLPLAYDLVNRRWMSLNGSFFYPDNDNYFQHNAQWDANCVFCHNVKAQPHIDFSTKQFSTEVSELGIACGACHGQTAAHAQDATSPLTRVAWRLQATGDKGIVDPLKLSSERSLMICGHCHGQRLPEPFDRIQTILTKGDPFNAGDDLTQYYRPIQRDSHVGETSFASRFWANGSPRLTAYEYQGILRSKCFSKGEPGKQINCLTCHTMHEGDPAGQITAENRTDKPCLGCHQKFAGNAALVAHTKHGADSSGSRCYNCHMPRAVYGIMTFHPTHDITVPDPQLTTSAAVPNACNQCHLDRGVNWSIMQTKKLWPERFRDAQPSKDEQFDLPEGPRALFAGDALTRALAADLLGGGGPIKPDPLWASPFLVEAMTDKYPIVRFFAANGLTRLPGSEKVFKPDYLATAAARERMLQEWRQLLTICPAETRQQALDLGTRLRAGRVDVDLEVGE